VRLEALSRLRSAIVTATHRVPTGPSIQTTK
jgi:hypothetical protein